MRSAVASRSHCATAPSTLTTRRPPVLAPLRKEYAAPRYEFRILWTSTEAKSVTVTLDTNVLQAYVEKRERKPVVESLLHSAASGTLDLAITSRYEADTPWNPRKDKIEKFLCTHKIPIIGSGFRFGYSRLGGYDMLGDGPGGIRSKLESIAPTRYPMWPPPDALGCSEYPSHLRKPKTSNPDWRDLDHLEAHYRAGRDKFVTLDRGILKLYDKLSRLGIVVITPEELIVSLNNLEQ